jgi:phosphoribosylglycinamide formyltransferase-1
MPATVDPAQALMPAVILISGAGSNMQAIAQKAVRRELPIEVRAVVSDRADAAGLEKARALGIPTEVLSPRHYADRASYDAALADVIEKHAPGLLILAGFMRILSSAFVQRFAGRALNIHPSLLPKFPGLHTHRRVLEAHEHEHGASVHFVTEELDGGPVIVQARVPVLPADDEASLGARVRVQEHRIYPAAVDWFARGRLTLQHHKACFDGQALDTPILVEITS